MQTRFCAIAALVLALGTAGCSALGGARATAAPPAASATPTAGQPAASATPSPAAEPATLLPPSAVEPPPATLTIGSQQQAAGIGSYCWSAGPPGGQGVGLCADKLGIITPLEPLAVPAGPFTAQFSLPLAAPPTLLSLNVMPATGRVTQFGEQGFQAWEPQAGEQRDVPLRQNPAIVLDLRPGLHLLALFAQWEGRGDVLYGFLVRVGETSGPAQGIDHDIQANAQGLPVTRRAVALGGEPAEALEGLLGRCRPGRSLPSGPRPFII